MIQLHIILVVFVHQHLYGGGDQQTYEPAYLAARVLTWSSARQRQIPE